MKIYKLTAKIPKECTGGDCYEVSGRYMMDQRFLGNPNLMLCHGVVIGQGKIRGVEYDHAWIEDGDTVIDRSNNREIRMPKEVYYAIGNIKNVKKYFYQDFSKMISKYKHWGPWE